MMRVLVFATLGFAVMGCTPTVLSIDDYETTCQANSDCVIVWLGDQCGRLQRRARSRERPIHSARYQPTATLRHLRARRGASAFMSSA
jgi:hypothetical protein